MQVRTDSGSHTSEPVVFSVGPDLDVTAVKSDGAAPWACDLVGRPFTALVPPEDRARVRRAAHDGTSVCHRLTAVDGCVVRTTFVRDGDIVVGHCLDVSDEEAQREKERFERDILRRLAAIHNEVLPHADVTAAFDQILALAVEVTDSERGFVGEVQDSPDGPVLAPRVTTGNGGIDAEVLESLCGSVLATGGATVAHHPDDLRHGASAADHQAIISFLGVPFGEDGHRGVLGLVNRPGGYDRGHLEALEPIADAGAALVATFAKRRTRASAEADLEFSWRIDKIVADMAIDLASAEAGLTADAVDGALGELGEVVGADRAYVFEFDIDSGTMSNSFEWCADGIEPARTMLQDLPIDSFPWVIEVLGTGEIIVAHTAELPAAAAVERAILEAQDIRSVMWFPLHTRGVLSGFVGFDQVRGQREWSALDTKALRSFAVELAAAITGMHVQRELRASEERLRVFTSGLGVGIFIANHDFTEGYLINPAFERLVGVSGDVFAKDPMAVLDAVHPDDAPELRALVAHHLSGLADIEDPQAVFDHTCRLWFRGGETRWVRLRAFPLDAPGSRRRVAGLVEDVTERRALQGELVTALARLAGANHAKTEFLSRVSHELRTPLNSAIGFVQLVRMDPDAAERDQFLERAERAGRHLVDLIDDLLDITRIEAGQVRLEMTDIDIAEVVREALDVHAGLIARHGISVHFEPPAVNTRIVTDRQRVLQILTNLVSNAAKYNLPGGELRVLLGRSDEGLSVTVSDTGRGLTTDELERVFVPFERLGADRSSVPGTGIGLPLSRQLAQAVGGHLEGESTLGEGTSFTLRLPTAAAASDLHEKYTVLVVDDSPDSLTMLETALGRIDGVTVHCVSRVEEALAAAAVDGADLVLLDRHLPDGDGIDVVPSFVALGTVSRPLQVVMVSADAQADVRERAHAAGARRYFTKPIDLGELVGFVRDQADNARP
jgi:PAS domain S-box-containing protein